MTTKQLANIYRRAAKKIASGEMECSCAAVDSLADLTLSLERRLYASIMLLPDDPRGYAALNIIENQPDPTQVRVLLLLLMAEWVETDYEGERP